MKSLAVRIPDHLRPFLRGLARIGTHGSTESAVVIAMLESDLRQMVRDEYARKAIAMMKELGK